MVHIKLITTDIRIFQNIKNLSTHFLGAFLFTKFLAYKDKNYYQTDMVYRNEIYKRMENIC